MVDPTESTEDVSSVMTGVLHNLERITTHFRDKGENEVANEIARHTIATVGIINHTMADWDMEASIMRPLPSAMISTSNLSSSAPVPATYGRDTKLRRESIASPSTSPPNISTWAAVAAVVPDKANKLIKPTPQDGMVQTRLREAEPIVATKEVDIGKRVVWIRGWTPHRSLSEITNKIGQGPIYSMVFSEAESAVCVIFQHTWSAKAICADDEHFIKTRGRSQFGPGCGITDGLPFPINDDLRRMSAPPNERRRLTFARSQLFTGGMTEEKFKKDIHGIVGKSNVELVWLFNSGNATVVLSAVPLARLVRNEFLTLAKSVSSPYYNVQISFSHDPCERPMTLSTQLQDGRASRTGNTYGLAGYSMNAFALNGAAAAGNNNGVNGNAANGRAGSSRDDKRRHTVGESDGWQTVSRKR